MDSASERAGFPMPSRRASATKSPPRVLQYDNTEDAANDRQGPSASRSKPQQAHMRGDQERGDQYDSPVCVWSLFVFMESDRWHREHEVKRADADRPAVDTLKTRFIELRGDFARVDVTMAMKVREEA
jgi:hypothetical protein